MANQLPKLPTTLNLSIGVHAHIAGPKLHEDHTCDYVTCLLCGKPGKVLLGVWLDLVLD
ncbi:hypothetical protein [Amycolatopsis sp. NPDC049159]|uniref:hypothetical protein n=1 Tax=Amycolatopsis sp. NPDC049159 TaxID=3157210 RepID=UPI0033E2EFAF